MSKMISRKQQLIFFLYFFIVAFLYAGGPSCGENGVNTLGDSYTVRSNQLGYRQGSSIHEEVSKCQYLKDISELSKNFATIIAFVVGGVWTYIAFIRRREKYPSAKISHRILHRSIDDNKVFLKVIVVIRNIGEVIISLDRRLVRIQQMIPWPAEELKLIDCCPRNMKTEADWPLLGEVDQPGEKQGYEIEPGEVDELHFDFIVPSNINTVVVYSYLKNVVKRGREIGWNKTSIYNIKKEKEI